MIYNIKDEKLDEIKYEEGFWTGKRTLTINDKELKKIDKNNFEFQNGEEVRKVQVTGNAITGVKLIDDNNNIELVSKPKWYEIVLSCFIFAFILIWGNSVTLCKIFPLVGGAIGGLISGAFAMLNLFAIKKVKKIWLKLLVFVGFFAITVLSCYLVAYLIISSMV